MSKAHRHSAVNLLLLVLFAWILVNYHLTQKLILIENGEFNHLIFFFNTTHVWAQIPLNKWGSTWTFNFKREVGWRQSWNPGSRTLIYQPIIRAQNYCVRNCQNLLPWEVKLFTKGHSQINLSFLYNFFPCNSTWHDCLMENFITSDWFLHVSWWRYLVFTQTYNTAWKLP